MGAPGPDVILHSTAACHRAARGFSASELIVVVGLAGVISAMAVPMMKAVLGDFSLTGDARGVSSAVSLAKLRAAASFSQARVFVDLDGRTYRVELWQKTPPMWVTKGGVKALSRTVNFGFGVVESARPFR